MLKNCPQEGDNCQTIVKILSQNNYLTFLIKYGPKEGRPKAATICLSKYKNKYPKNNMFTVVDDVELPEDDVSMIFVVLGYLYNFFTILRGPSGIHQNHII